MRRTRVMCAMVVAGLLSWTMLAQEATAATNCGARLVGKTFQCENVTQGEATLEFIVEFTSPGTLGDFDLVLAFGASLGCSCRTAGNKITNPKFDQDKHEFLCVGDLGTNTAVGLVGKVLSGGRITMEEIVVPLQPNSGLNNCVEVEP